MRKELETTHSVEERVTKAIDYLRSERLSDWKRIYLDLLARAMWMPKMASETKALQEELLEVILTAHNVWGVQKKELARLVLASLDGLAMQYLQGVPEGEIALAYNLLEKTILRMVQTEKES